MPEMNACLDAMNLPILKAKTIVWIYYTINCEIVEMSNKCAKIMLVKVFKKDWCKCIIVLEHIAKIVVSIYDMGDKNKM